MAIVAKIAIFVICGQVCRENYEVCRDAKTLDMRLQAHIAATS